MRSLIGVVASILRRCFSVSLAASSWRESWSGSRRKDCTGGAGSGAGVVVRRLVNNSFALVTMEGPRFRDWSVSVVDVGTFVDRRLVAARNLCKKDGLLWDGSGGSGSAGFRLPVSLSK
ncbi:hypothetical protein BDR22DRAFT_178411 [Usnea florida]